MNVSSIPGNQTKYIICFAVLALIGWSVGGGLTGRQTNVVSAEEFRLVDKHGRPVGTWTCDAGIVAMRMGDGEHSTRVCIGTSADGFSYLRLGGDLDRAIVAVEVIGREAMEKQALALRMPKGGRWPVGSISVAGNPSVVDGGQGGVFIRLLSDGSAELSVGGRDSGTFTVLSGDWAETVRRLCGNDMATGHGSNNGAASRNMEVAESRKTYVLTADNPTIPFREL
jgi:hypothetical protein